MNAGEKIGIGGLDAQEVAVGAGLLPAPVGLPRLLPEGKGDAEPLGQRLRDRALLDLGHGPALDDAKTLLTQGHVAQGRAHGGDVGQGLGRLQGPLQVAADQCVQAL